MGMRTVFSEGFQEVEPEPAIKCDCFTAPNITLSPLTTTLACFQLLDLHKFSLASGPLHMPFLRPTASFPSLSLPAQDQVLFSNF